MKMLLIDDHPNTKLHFTIQELEKYNIEYIITFTFDGARKLIDDKSNNFIGVVTDLGFPIKEDGTEYEDKMGILLIRLINKIYPELPILINSRTHLLENERKSIKIFNQIIPGDIKSIDEFIEYCCSKS